MAPISEGVNLRLGGGVGLNLSARQIKCRAPYNENDIGVKFFLIKFLGFGGEAETPGVGGGVSPY